jgi:UDP-4-amino-4,6-dideoxy-N-acetyl-beta-L-altrosamine transaminase
MIPYGRQDISEADIQAVVDVLRSDWLTQGPAVPRFERCVADYTGAVHAVAANSATGALHIACLALGVGPGDCVWTSPNTFVASANCALYCGADVDFVDIDARTYNMSVQCLADKLQSAEKSGRLPKVVIPVHFAGQPCEMQQIHELGRQYGFRIIEDASHAIGASYGGSKVGCCQHSDITVFSFHPVKIITTGEGGMAMTNDAELAERMMRFRTHGITTRPDRMQPRPEHEIWNYQQIDLGYNYRMTDIQAALGVSQMQRLDEFVRRRHEIAADYGRLLGGLPLILPHQRSEVRSSFHLYPVRLRETVCKVSHRLCYERLKEAKIGVNLHYIPVYQQPFYLALGFTKGLCPEAEAYFHETISLPLYPTLAAGEANSVVDSLKMALALGE